MLELHQIIEDDAADKAAAAAAQRLSNSRSPSPNVFSKANSPSPSGATASTHQRRFLQQSLQRSTFSFDSSDENISLSKSQNSLQTKLKSIKQKLRLTLVLLLPLFLGLIVAGIIISILKTNHSADDIIVVGLENKPAYEDDVERFNGDETNSEGEDVPWWKDLQSFNLHLEFAKHKKTLDYVRIEDITGEFVSETPPTESTVKYLEEEMYKNIEKYQKASPFIPVELMKTIEKKYYEVASVTPSNTLLQRFLRLVEKDDDAIPSISFSEYGSRVKEVFLLFDEWIYLFVKNPNIQNLLVFLTKACNVLLFGNEKCTFLISFISSFISDKNVLISMVSNAFIKFWDREKDLFFHYSYVFAFVIQEYLRHRIVLKEEILHWLGDYSRKFTMVYTVIHYLTIDPLGGGSIPLDNLLEFAKQVLEWLEATREHHSKSNSSAERYKTKAQIVEDFMWHFSFSIYEVIPSLDSEIFLDEETEYKTHYVLNELHKRLLDFHVGKALKKPEYISRDNEKKIINYLHKFISPIIIKLFPTVKKKAFQRSLTSHRRFILSLFQYSGLAPLLVYSQNSQKDKSHLNLTNFLRNYVAFANFSPRKSMIYLSAFIEAVWTFSSFPRPYYYIHSIRKERFTNYILNLSLLHFVNVNGLSSSYSGLVSFSWKIVTKLYLMNLLTPDVLFVFLAEICSLAASILSERLPLDENMYLTNLIMKFLATRHFFIISTPPNQRNKFFSISASEVFFHYDEIEAYVLEDLFNLEPEPIEVIEEEHSPPSLLFA